VFFAILQFCGKINFKWKIKMVLDQVFERFIQESPVAVMVHGLLEKVLCPQQLDELFEKKAKT